MTSDFRGELSILSQMDSIPSLKFSKETLQRTSSSTEEELFERILHKACSLVFVLVFFLEKEIEKRLLFLGKEDSVEIYPRNKL